MANPNILGLDGFEYGIYDADDYFGTSGTATREVITAAARSGSYGLHHSHSATRAYTMLGSLATGEACIRLYMKFVTVPTVDTPIALTGTAGGRYGIAVKSTGKFATFVNDGTNTTYGADGPSVTTGQWYRIEFKYNTAGTGTCDGYIDGVALGQATRVTTGVPADLYLFGHSSANWGTTTIDAYVDDVIWYAAGSTPPAPWPVGDGEVIGLKVNANGTHSVAGNFTQQPGASSPPSDAQAAVNDAPPYGSDAGYVYKSTAGASTDYLEFAVEDLPAATAINGIGYAGWWSNNGAGDVIINAGVRVREPANAVEEVVMAGAYIVHSSGQITVVPCDGFTTAAAWTKTLIDGLLIRMGQSTQAVTTQGRMHAAMLQVDFVRGVTPVSGLGGGTQELPVSRPKARWQQVPFRLPGI